MIFGGSVDPFSGNSPCPTSYLLYIRGKSKAGKPHQNTSEEPMTADWLSATSFHTTDAHTTVKWWIIIRFICCYVPPSQWKKCVLISNGGIIIWWKWSGSLLCSLIKTLILPWCYITTCFHCSASFALCRELKAIVSKATKLRSQQGTFLAMWDYMWWDTCQCYSAEKRVSLYLCVFMYLCTVFAPSLKVWRKD